MENLIEVDNIHKKFCRNLSMALHYGFVDSISKTFRRAQEKPPLRKGEFWALQEISFSLKRGDRLGILGRNGAGKSTLMKIVAGILAPDAGAVRINGSIDQMIELTGGFHPMMTGYQNAKIRARLKGMTESEFEASLKGLIEFTGLEDAIHTPVKYYSSGMRARLGFAVSTLRKPDILIIDEALAVGDLDFRLKCYEFIANHLKDTALIFVSHSLGHIKRFCNQGMVLEKGRIKHYGDVLKAIELYQEMGSSTGDMSASRGLNPEMLSFNLQTGSGGGLLSFGDELIINVEPKSVPADAMVSIQLADNTGKALLELRSERSPRPLDVSKPFSCSLGKMYLNAGYYLINIIVYASDSYTLLSYAPWKKLQSKGSLSGHAPVQPEGHWNQVQ